MSQNKSRRPTSIGHIALVRAVCIGSGCMSGAAIAFGTLPDAMASGGLSVALPVILAIVVSVGLSAAWHKLVGYAAHARKPHERAMALGFGLAAGFFGLWLSGWFLASIIGGRPAQQDYRAAYVERLRAVSDGIAGNAAIEHQIIVALDTAATNLEAAAKTDAATGLLSGRRGTSIVVNSVRDVAAAMTRMSRELTDQQHTQSKALGRAADALNGAAKNAAADDAAGFQEDATRAANELRAAAKIRLGAASLNIGSAVAPGVQRFISETVAMLGSVIEDVNARRRPVTVPDFQPVDNKTALQRAPQPLAILAAVAVELVPLLCLGLLLTIWRDEESTGDPAGEGENVVPIRPRAPSPPANPAPYPMTPAE